MYGLQQTYIQLESHRRVYDKHVCQACRCVAVALLRAFDSLDSVFGIKGEIEIDFVKPSIPIQQAVKHAALSLRGIPQRQTSDQIHSTRINIVTQS